MAKKIRIGIIYGGKSAEHEVSLKSARAIAQAIDKSKYDVALIGIDQQGQWFFDNGQRLLGTTGESVAELTAGDEPLIARPGAAGSELMAVQNDHLNARPLDVVFPVLHGTYGEDGSVQGLLKLANIPFVGPSVLGSAVGMDKDVMKRLLRDAGIPIGKFITLHKHQASSLNYQSAVAQLGSPLFIKPANAGSSVGVSKVKTAEEFERATADAFQYDTKIIIEEYIPGREIECSVLGNEKLIASVPGEVIPQHEFYSYEAKYLDDNGALLKIPAELSHAVVKQVQQLAIQTCQTLCCEGMSRVDMFLKEDGSIFVNEINTIPGFTAISMYPKLWEASGIPFPELIDRLILLATARNTREGKLKTAFDL